MTPCLYRSFPPLGSRCCFGFCISFCQTWLTPAFVLVNLSTARGKTPLEILRFNGIGRTQANWSENGEEGKEEDASSEGTIGNGHVCSLYTHMCCNCQPQEPRSPKRAKPHQFAHQPIPRA